MPSYHCSVKTGGKGRAGKHADYISREGKYAPELARGTSKLEDLEHTESGNMPAWAAHDAGVFWKAADEQERANGATYREIEVALPRELNPDQRRALVDDFVRQQIGDRHPFTYAIHIPKAAIEKGEQPHAHIMYSERTLDGIARDPDQFFKRANSKAPEKGGCKKDSAGTKERLLATRELWADVQNKHLERAGVDARVSHLSLRAQGIDRTPEIHLGPVLARQHAPALREHRAAERELAQAPQVNAAAELAAQAQQAQQQADQAEAQQREAARQAQAQAAAQQAQREAAEAARQEQARAAAVQAEREAEAAAQAAAAAAAQAAAQAKREAALNAQLTAEKEEKENDRIRAAAFESIRNNVNAASKDSTRFSQLDSFMQSDHAKTDRDIKSVEHAIDSSTRDLYSARASADGNDKLADRNGRSLGRALQGAERRVFRENINRSAPAVKQQLGTVNRVVQQAVEFFPAVVRAIAAAAQAVTRQIQKAAARAPERPTVPAQTQAKAIPAAAPEKPPAPVLEPALNEADRKLIARLDEAIERAAQGDQKAMDSLPGLLDKLDDAQRDAASAYYRVAPKDFNYGYAERDAKQAREAAAKLDVNKQAAARGVGAVPYPPGLSGQWATDHHSSYETALAKATKELGYHAREPRPEGFWKKKETAAYDAKTAELQSKVSGWEREIGWRDGALRAASKAREPQDAQHIARAKEIHDREQAPTAAKAEPAKARNEAHKRENSRLQEKIERLFDKPKQRELDQKQRDHGQDYGR